MCRFIKEDGERCGIDAEPFCHMHEDTPQSHFYHSMEELKEDLGEVMEMVDEARSQDAEGGSSAIEMDATCGDCEAPLRRTERLTEHPRFGGQVLFEAVVEYDCWPYSSAHSPSAWANCQRGGSDGAIWWRRSPRRS